MLPGRSAAAPRRALVEPPPHRRRHRPSAERTGALPFAYMPRSPSPPSRPTVPLKKQNDAPQTIGLAAPGLLAALRVVQGLAIGGEYGCAVVYAAEISPPGWEGRSGSWMVAFCQGGLLLGQVAVMAGAQSRRGGVLFSTAQRRGRNQACGVSAIAAVGQLMTPLAPLATRLPPSFLSRPHSHSTRSRRAVQPPATRALGLAHPVPPRRVQRRPGGTHAVRRRRLAMKNKQRHFGRQPQ